MRPKPLKPADPGELVTLWHVGGAKPCQGPALKVPSEFLESEEPSLPEGCELPDGSKLIPGEPPVCGTCGEQLGEDLSAQLALSRERYRA